LVKFFLIVISQNVIIISKNNCSIFLEKQNKKVKKQSLTTAKSMLKHRRNFRGRVWGGPDPTFWSGKTDPHFIIQSSQKFCLVPLTFQTKITPLCSS